MSDVLRDAKALRHKLERREVWRDAIALAVMTALSLWLTFKGVLS